MRVEREKAGLPARLGLGIFGVLSAWLVGELLVAGFFKEEGALLQFNFPIVDMLQPPTFQPEPVNSHGFRDNEHTFEKPLGVFRILVLGDSFTFGAGVRMRESYPYRLGQILRERHRGRVEVINTGVPGTGTAHQLLYFLDRGHRFSPDVVLLGYFDWNDAVDNMNSGIYSLEGGALVHHDPPWIATRYRLGHWLAGSEATFSASVWIRRSRLMTFALNRVNTWTGFVNFFSAARDTPAALDLAYALVRRMAEEARNRNARFAVVRIPGYAEHVGKEFATIKRACDDSSVPLLDLEPTLAQAIAKTQRRDAIFIPSDGHFTVEGNRIAAEAIATFLETLGWIHTSK